MLWFLIKVYEVHVPPTKPGMVVVFTPAPLLRPHFWPICRVSRSNAAEISLITFFTTGFLQKR